MPVDRASDAELSALSDLIDRWTVKEKARNPLLLAVDHEPELRRWYVRLKGEDKAVITVWLTLRERTLHYETYFMPAPEEQVEACYEYLLRANGRLFAMRFALGPEDAVYLVGQLPVTAIDESELDRVVGSAYAYSEQYFAPAMGLGYASKFRRN
jgi:hypothetical protein